jgi:hypothetical protein
MKTIKVKYVGFWDTHDFRIEHFHKILEKHYHIEESDAPDFVICSVFGEPYTFCQYPQPRIMFSGENYIPDMNLVDYAIAPYPLSFGDRYCFFPVCVDNMGHCSELGKKDRNYSKDILLQKNYFANFIAGHESEHNIRGDFFKRLCEYKRVESPGSYLNNMSEPITLSHLDGSKIAFQRKCKFTLCFESTKHEGFVTEKITDAFYSDTIPVYYGSSTVKQIFNPKAFIDCSDYPSMDAVIDKIIELDQDDDKYMEMLRQPIFNDPHFVDNIMSNLENFILSIFEQSPSEAYRRSRVFWGKRYNDHLRHASQSLWFTKQEQMRAQQNEKLVRRANRSHFIQTIPNRLARMILGNKLYEAIKKAKKG